MAKIKDLKKVLIFGSGPIVIGQACEFDYSGTQACKALMAEGLEVILVNSNPATIMTDPEIATRVYIEPLKVPFIEKIIEKEKPDAVIPTLGGQTALNLALELDREGVLEKHGVDMLGATPEVIRRAEDREEFMKVLDSVGARYPKSAMVTNMDEGMKALEELDFPIIMRPNYTLGGGGGGVAYSVEEYKRQLALGLQESPTSEVLVERSLLGWKEYELEVMRDKNGTFVVICSIENFDACGVHTGDSITVAPQQTLTDRQYQELRTEGKAILNAVGVETGGANIQFAVHPETGERVVIEMNPRVSRSSALASKATGFPIAKIAALLAIGYRLDELKNDITGSTPSCYEPALDYVVTKIPRFAFEKFPGSRDYLTTQMKSVGEVMGIGRTFKESFMKAISSMEESAGGFDFGAFKESDLSYPNSKRVHAIGSALKSGVSVEDVSKLTEINPWYIEQLEDIIQVMNAIEEKGLEPGLLQKAKRYGISDKQIAGLTEKSEIEVRKARWDSGIHPAFFQVDTCAGEFASQTPYYYSTYWSTPAAQQDKGKKVVILGSGPNRIGQGIEFDYGCVRAVRQFQKQGYSVVMVNSNPETVSTDYDTSDQLFFEPLTEESVLEIMRHVQAEGAVIQLGGQTPINLAKGIDEAGFGIMGSSLATIDLAEDREQFVKVCNEFDFKIPASGMAGSLEVAQQITSKIGYPVMCRPSYVLGGRRMEVVESDEDLVSYFERHGSVISDSRPTLIDEFLDGALEVDVDVVRGKDWTVIAGIIEHIEAAGVHSGDSMGVLPPQRLKPATSEKIEELSKSLADKMGVIGHLNLQLAIKNDQIYMIEANPRSSRSVPFVAKAAGVPAVDLGVKAVLGLTAKEVGPENYDWKSVKNVSVKGVVFPFKKFPEADSILGPEMKSTGESMGRGSDFSEALLKAFYSSQLRLPSDEGEVFFSLRDKDKNTLLPIAKKLKEMGYGISATRGTAAFLEENGIECLALKKVHEGRPHCVDRIRSGEVAFVINTTTGRRAIEASFGIRRSCVDYSIPCITESDVAEAFVMALQKKRTGKYSVTPLEKPLT